jgi:hypothetical protein
MAHMGCVLEKEGYTHAHACTRPRTRAPTRMHARTLTHKHIYLLLFHGKNCYAKVPQCYVIRTLPLFF